MGMVIEKQNAGAKAGSEDHKDEESLDDSKGKGENWLQRKRFRQYEESEINKAREEHSHSPRSSPDVKEKTKEKSPSPAPPAEPKPIEPEKKEAETKEPSEESAKKDEESEEGSIVIDGKKF